MRKQITTILSAGLMLTTVFSTPVFAAESYTNATDELWVAPTVVYGGALSESERNQVATKLGADRGKVTELETEGTDVDKYLGTNGVSTSSLISCVEVTTAASFIRIISNTQYFANILDLALPNGRLGF